jgi:CubicO group peptidase (beta-lactamase class C family)
MRKHKYFIVLLVSFCFKQIGTAQETPAFVKDSLDNYVQRALTTWKIPGVAVCIVKDGKVVLMKGYGVRETGAADKVDEHTLFMIGSNTKAFTGTALAMLDASKKMSLDDKVVKWLSDFKLYDPWVTKEATVRDLLCHRLGFETFQGDFMYFDSDLSLAQVREKMGKLKPLHSFRSRWGYTNSAFLTAGEVIPKVTGKSWAEFIKDSIFTPLGMERSLAHSSEILTANNKAAAHTIIDGQIKKVAYGRLENMGPAGSISSSVSDLSKWVLMQLDNGKLDGKQVIAPAALRQTWRPASILGNGGSKFNTGHFLLYGLGWMLEEYNGKKIVSHTGGVNGFVTSVTLIPEKKLGIVVLTNTDENSFFESLKWELMDAYMKLPYRNYSDVDYQSYSQSKQEQAKWLQAKRDTIATNPKPALALQSFAGSYKHEVYGNMNIALKDGKLIATFEHHTGRFATLEPLGQNRFLATFNEVLFGTKVWPFTIKNGKVQSVTVTVADFVEFTPYEFYKIK